MVVSVTSESRYSRKTVCEETSHSRITWCCATSRRVPSKYQATPSTDSVLESYSDRVATCVADFTSQILTLQAPGIARRALSGLQLTEYTSSSVSCSTASTCASVVASQTR